MIKSRTSPIPTHLSYSPSKSKSHSSSKFPQLRMVRTSHQQQGSHDELCLPRMTTSITTRLLPFWKSKIHEVHDSLPSQPIYLWLTMTGLSFVRQHVNHPTIVGLCLIVILALQVSPKDAHSLRSCHSHF